MSGSDKCVFTGLITFQPTGIIMQLQKWLFKSQLVPDWSYQVTEFPHDTYFKETVYAHLLSLMSFQAWTTKQVMFDIKCCFNITVNVLFLCILFYIILVNWYYFLKNSNYFTFLKKLKTMFWTCVQGWAYAFQTKQFYIQQKQ